MRIISRMGLQTFPVDFDGGINMSEDPMAVKGNEAMFCANVRAFPPNWHLEKRFGKTFKYSLNNVADRAITINRFVSATGGSQWYVAGTSVPARAVQNLTEGLILTPSTGLGTPNLGTFKPRGAQTDDIVWIQGVDPPQKWGPLTTVPAPTSMALWANSPPVGSIVLYWRGRIIVTGSNDTGLVRRVWFSDIGNPESPATLYGNNFIDIPAPGDPRVTCAKVLGENLLVFTGNSVSIVYDINTFANRVISRDAGTIDQDSAAVVGGQCYFIDGTNSSLYKTDGRSVQRVDINKVERLFKAWGQFGGWALGNADNRLIIKVGTDSSSGGSQGIIEYIPETGAWYPHTYAPISLFCGPSNVPGLQNQGGEVFIADQGNNTVSQIFTGQNDGPTGSPIPINAVWQSGWQGIQEIEKFERVRRFNLIYKGLVTVSLYTEFDLTTPNFTFTPTELPIELLTPIANQPLNFGIGPQSTRKPYGFARGRPEVRSRYRSVKLSDNTLSKFFSVRRAEMVIRGGREH